MPIVVSAATPTIAVPRTDPMMNAAIDTCAMKTPTMAQSSRAASSTASQPWDGLPAEKASRPPSLSSTWQGRDDRWRRLARGSRKGHPLHIPPVVDEVVAAHLQVAPDALRVRLLDFLFRLGLLLRRWMKARATTPVAPASADALPSSGSRAPGRRLSAVEQGGDVCVVDFLDFRGRVVDELLDRAFHLRDDRPRVLDQVDEDLNGATRNELDEFFDLDGNAQTLRQNSTIRPITSLKKSTCGHDVTDEGAQPFDEVFDERSDPAGDL